MNDSESARADGSTWWGQTDSDKRNNKAFTMWCLIWAVSFCAVTFALESAPDLRGPIAWALVAIPIVLGAMAVRAFLRFLREADEFIRKVQLEGIALGFVAGHLFCISYFLLERVGAPELPLIIAVVPMAFGWAAGSMLVALKYR